MKDLTVGKEWKLILGFALPMLIGNVFQQLYNIVDTIILGNYIGKHAIAAVGASFPVIFVLISLVIGISSGITIVISQYYGAKQMDNVRKSIDTMVAFVLVSSVVVTVLGITITEPLFRLLQLPLEVFPDAKIYLHIYFYGIILLFGFYTVAGILRGLGDSKTPLYFQIISTILNIVLDYIFIAWYDMGIKGAAYGTLIAQGFSFFGSIWYVNKYHTFIKLRLKGLEFSKSIFYKSMKIGIPSGLQHTFVSLGMLAIIRIVNDFGTSTLAAYSIAGRIDSFAAIPAMIFSATLATFTGQNLGADKPERVKRGLYATLIMTNTISVIVSIVVYFFGHDLMNIFTDDIEVINLGYQYLIIVCSFYIIFSTMFVLNGLFRGAGDTIIPMIITLIALWLFRIPSSWYLSREYDAIGIWWGIPVAWFVGMIFSLIYYYKGNWKDKVITKVESPELIEPAKELSLNN